MISFNPIQHYAAQLNIAKNRKLNAELQKLVHEDDLNNIFDFILCSLNQVNPENTSSLLDTERTRLREKIKGFTEYETAAAFELGRALSALEPGKAHRLGKELGPRLERSIVIFRLADGSYSTVVETKSKLKDHRNGRNAKQNLPYIGGASKSGKPAWQVTPSEKEMFHLRITSPQGLSDAVKEANLLQEFDSPFVDKLLVGPQFRKHFSNRISLYGYKAKGTLNDLLEKRECRTTQVQHNLVFDMLLGLKEIQSKDYVHQDIKPDNLLLDTNNRLRVADVGITRKEGSSSIGGTTPYMAPEIFLSTTFSSRRSLGEQLKYEKDVSRLTTGNRKSSDIWAVGITAWMIFNNTNRTPDTKDYRALQTRFRENDTLEKLAGMTEPQRQEHQRDRFLLDLLNVNRYTRLDVDQAIASLSALMTEPEIQARFEMDRQQAFEKERDIKAQHAQEMQFLQVRRQEIRRQKIAQHKQIEDRLLVLNKRLTKADQRLPSLSQETKVLEHEVLMFERLFSSTKEFEQFTHANQTQLNALLEKQDLLQSGKIETQGKIMVIRQALSGSPAKALAKTYSDRIVVLQKRLEAINNQLQPTQDAIKELSGMLESLSSTEKRAAFLKAKKDKVRVKQDFAKDLREQMPKWSASKAILEKYLPELTPFLSDKTPADIVLPQYKVVKRSTPSSPSPALTPSPAFAPSPAFTPAFAPSPSPENELALNLQKFQEIQEGAEELREIVELLKMLEGLEGLEGVRKNKPY